MLQKLVIKNYAIIDNLEISPDGNLNTVTGETGAGKSIILGALSLILGDRADTSVLINKTEKCVVEAHFNVSDNAAFANTLHDEDIDNEEVCIIRREISTAGKSRAFVNDTPVTLDVLSKLTSLLVDLQQQFGHLALQEDAFQFDVVDAIAGNADLRKKYTLSYNEYRQKKAQLEKLKQEQAALQKEADYKQFLLNELTDANFKEQEIENADLQLKQLSHAEKIVAALQSSRMMLEEGEQPLTNELKRMSQQLQSIAEVMPDSVPVQQRIMAAWAELKDVASELERLESKVNIDESLMQQLQERIDVGYKLLKKHAVQTTNDLLQIQESLATGMQGMNDLGDKIKTLEVELTTIYTTLKKLASDISAKRQKAIPGFEKKVNELLALVGMPNATIRIVMAVLDEPGKYGVDTVALMLDANKSGQFQPIYKAASGGEMSRIMLCIKSLTAKAMDMPTLIFDEVDTGISGEAARQVGLLLRELATYHQLICITHQPQVAAKGTRHFYVYKDESKDKRITTKVKTLQADERILAIAKMIGGETPSDAAIQNAKELIAA
ncbi:MAG: DNA repair protein RecN [Bacteroidetes bacterium]|nr:DNA repair protein RecN [Bacteroidota bacterium]